MTHMTPAWALMKLNSCRKKDLGAWPLRSLSKQFERARSGVISRMLLERKARTKQVCGPKRIQACPICQIIIIRSRNELVWCSMCSQQSFRVEPFLGSIRQMMIHLFNLDLIDLRFEAISPIHIILSIILYQLLYHISMLISVYHLHLYSPLNSVATSVPSDSAASVPFDSLRPAAVQPPVPSDATGVACPGPWRCPSWPCCAR